MRRLLWIILIIGVLSFVPPAFGYPVPWDNMETGPSFLQDKVESTVAWTSFSADVVKDTRSSASLGYSSLYGDFQGRFDVPSGPHATPLSTSLSSGEGTLLPVPETGTGRSSEDIQKVVINETDLSVVILLNGTYAPGDPIRVDFFITNKVGTVKEIEIGLDVYYLGIKVFSYQHPSWREYSEGNTIHIYHESRLPTITPPGRYRLVFKITPAGRDTSVASTEITVAPSATWFMLVLAFMGLLVGAVYVVIHYDRYIKRLRGIYAGLSTSQKFILSAVVGVTVAIFMLTAGAENFANNVAILVYYLLLVGVLSLWVEYFKPQWGGSCTQLGVGVVFLAGLVYLSREIFTVYFPMSLFVLGMILVGMAFRRNEFRRLRHRKEDKVSASPRIVEIEIVGETEEGFIIFRKKGED
ncbi:hypothetical protein [Thermococcus sp. MV11]|uniref:hypothetical protein n=1 Tax=Thermococcus sp. MV11 TaxID=1638267 RepID=UPI00142FC18C|nr:hypothetical protein [Thermococcus sp. MV11]NJE03850.1 hypothetical protein [Thermococcus sp. MV11]